MNKNLLLILSIFLLGSCTSYRYTKQNFPSENSRTKGITNDVTLAARQAFSVDVRVDIDKIVTATSETHENEEDAKNEAYYNCIINNDVDIVVDPIWRETVIEAPGPFKFLYKNQYKYEIRGYAGYYENLKDVGDTELQDAKDALALKQIQLELAKLDYEKEDALFQVRGKNLNAMAKISPEARESKSSYMIETEEGCCPNNNNNVNVNSNSSGSGFGNVHLLHTADNKSSLVDEYLKLICDDCDDDASKAAKPKASKSKVLSMGSGSNSSTGSKEGFFCKIPLLKKFLCK